MESSRLQIVRVIASGLGSGLMPFAPGTFGTIAGTAAWLAIDVITPFSTFQAAVLALVIAALGMASTQRALQVSSESDPQWVVIDEWAGVAFALISVPALRESSGYTTLTIAVGAFLLFRLFDITKPGPVAWGERLPGAWGVMADDVIAGIFALAILLVLF